MSAPKRTNPTAESPSFKKPIVIPTATRLKSYFSGSSANLFGTDPENEKMDLSSSEDSSFGAIGTGRPSVRPFASTMSAGSAGASHATAAGDLTKYSPGTLAFAYSCLESGGTMLNHKAFTALFSNRSFAEARAFCASFLASSAKVSKSATIGVVSSVSPKDYSLLSDIDFINASISGRDVANVTVFFVSCRAESFRKLPGVTSTLVGGDGHTILTNSHKYLTYSIDLHNGQLYANNDYGESMKMNDKEFIKRFADSGLGKLIIVPEKSKAHIYVKLFLAAFVIKPTLTGATVSPAKYDKPIPAITAFKNDPVVRGACDVVRKVRGNNIDFYSYLYQYFDGKTVSVRTPIVKRNPKELSTPLAQFHKAKTIPVMEKLVTAYSRAVGSAVSAPYSKISRSANSVTGGKAGYPVEKTMFTRKFHKIHDVFMSLNEVEELPHILVSDDPDVISYFVSLRITNIAITTKRYLKFPLLEDAPKNRILPGVIPSKVFNNTKYSSHFKNRNVIVYGLDDDIVNKPIVKKALDVILDGLDKNVLHFVRPPLSISSDFSEKGVTTLNDPFFEGILGNTRGPSARVIPTSVHGCLIYSIFNYGKSYSEAINRRLRSLFALSLITAVRAQWKYAEYQFSKTANGEDAEPLMGYMDDLTIVKNLSLRNAADDIVRRTPKLSLQLKKAEMETELF